MSEIIDIAKKCISDEAQALINLLPLINEDFERAVQLIYNCKGKVIVTGVGKSGHCGAKIAATLASLGTPSFFLNPLDAYHGDLGMVGEDDVVIAISYSGNTDELLRIVPQMINRNIPIIGMTGKQSSLLAQYSRCVLSITVEREADPLNLAPTSSTTATLAMGDALACALVKARNFQAKDFAKFHPGGSLGKRLLCSIKSIARTENVPVIKLGMKLADIILTISNGKLGLAVVTDDDNHVIGLITDGDVRRAMIRFGKEFFDVVADEIINRNPLTINANVKLEEAAELFSKKNVYCVVVTDDEGKLIGVLESYKCIM